MRWRPVGHRPGEGGYGAAPHGCLGVKRAADPRIPGLRPSIYAQPRLSRGDGGRAAPGELIRGCLEKPPSPMAFEIRAC
ncbi:MAG: hypothetical protein QW569_05445 [Candidatus Bathyarchaeia archaeon]|nr:hypothetical protein [Candidatus Bathyarchaeota archaeon]